jgi:quinol monooxygenase YgiN
MTGTSKIRALTIAIFATLLIACEAAVPIVNTQEERVTLLIHFEANDRGLEEFSEIMSGVSAAMQTEPGFVSAVVYNNVDDPNTFVLAEVWETKRDHLEHFDRIVASGEWARINGLLTSKPEMGYFIEQAPAH